MKNVKESIIQWFNNFSKRNKIFIIGIVIVVGILFLTTINGNYGTSKQKEYLEKASKNLTSISRNPISSIHDAQIIEYGNDILVTMRYNTRDIYGNLNSYSSTFSINRNDYINTIELENMMATNEWKNARTTDIDWNIIKKVNKNF